MEYNVYVQHFTELNFDENFKIKPNQVQMLYFIRQEEKNVVPHLHKKAMIIENGRWSMAEVKFWWRNNVSCSEIEVLIV